MGGDVCPGASPAAKGPRSQSVSHPAHGELAVWILARLVLNSVVQEWVGVCKAVIMALSHEVDRKLWKYNQTGPCIGALEMWEDPGDGDPSRG